MPSRFGNPQSLALALLAGPWRPEDVRQRALEWIGATRPRVVALVKRVMAHWPTEPPRLRDLTHFLRQDRVWQRLAVLIVHRRRVQPDLHQRMRPLPVAAGWNVPPLVSIGHLAERLQVTIGELEWLADAQQRQRHVADGPLQHYSYRWIRKRDGSARLIEAPKPRLKAIQRWLLEHVLRSVPAHPAAHAFVPGRSVSSFVAPHVGQTLVMRFDLSDFFPMISPAQVKTVFLSLGYPEPIARLLLGLCTNELPLDLQENVPGVRDLRERDRLLRLYGRRHLPQGSPCSPALANLCAFRLDLRLSLLAKACHANYTRYADDLLFSGDEGFARAADRFRALVAAIVDEEGHRVHQRKTRLMRQGVRQHAAGLTLNRLPNVRRAEYDRLKAILYRCAQHGPHTENRLQHPHFQSHLAGRVSYVASIHPQRGAKLQRLFAQIDWSPGLLPGDGGQA